MRGARYEAVLMLLRVPRNKADEVQSCQNYVNYLSGMITFVFSLML